MQSDKLYRLQNRRCKVLDGIDGQKIASKNMQTIRVCDQKSPALSVNSEKRTKPGALSLKNAISANAANPLTLNFVWYRSNLL